MGTMYLQKDCVWVVAEGNDLLLYGPKGEELPAQEALTATADIADGIATCTVSFVCNIAGSKEEMMQKIEELENTYRPNTEVSNETLEKVRLKIRKNRFMEWVQKLIDGVQQ